MGCALEVENRPEPWYCTMLMICENCQQHEATVHLTQVVDGEVTKYHLCESCAVSKGIDVHATPLDLSELMANLKKKLTQLQTEFQTPQSPEPTACPGCGGTRTEILKKGRFGCEQCYEVFADDILPIIISLQQKDQHVGKVPQRASLRLKNSVTLTRLRRELDQAIASENYEEAATLRDQIRALQTEAPVS